MTASVAAALAWIGAHPLWAGALLFAVAFFDALALIGIAVPSLPLLLGVGALIGLGRIDPTYAVLCAASGAIAGDGLSYLLGRASGERLRGMWPFSRHPEWLLHGEGFLHRHGVKGIVIARYVGAVRPFVPMIAGMLRMPAWRYLAASIPAALSWALLFMAPGWVFGASMDLFAAVAGPLAALVGVVLALAALLTIAVVALYRVLAPRTVLILERTLDWSHRHPVLGRFSTALMDPRRRESPSLALLALGLVGCGWAAFTLLLVNLGPAGSRPLDAAVEQAMRQLRSPLADSAMAALAGLGEWSLLLPPVLLVFGWLWWRRRHAAAWHWLTAPAAATALAAVLDALLRHASAGPATPLYGPALGTAVFGFFAVLIARELPGRRRAWPYVAACLLVALPALAELYFGHWRFSEAALGVLLVAAWVAGLGIAYRRRIVRSFWVRPAAAIFFGSLALTAAFYLPARVPARLAAEAQPVVREAMPAADWWRDGWQTLPARRNRLSGAPGWPLNLQYAGSPEHLAQVLAAHGWRRQAAAGWKDLLRSLDRATGAGTLPILPAAHEGRGEALLFSRPAEAADARWVLRLWLAAYALQPGAAPLWIGSVQRLQFRRRWRLIAYWHAEPAAPEQLGVALAGWPQRGGARPDDAVEVLRVAEPAVARP